MNKKLLFGGLIGSFLVIMGGLYFFVSSKSPQGIEASNSSDWCKSKEFSKSVEVVLREGASLGPNDFVPQELFDANVKQSIAYIQLASQEAEKQGVKISQSELCALHIAMQERMSADLKSGNFSLTESNFPSVAELAKYIGNDRATIVLNNQNQKITSSDKDADAKEIIILTPFSIRACILDKMNRVLEPQSSHPICQTREQNSQNTALWGDLEKVGGKWGGCPFQVKRNADGVISDIQYCATLPSGIQAVCTLNRCSYDGQKIPSALRKD